MFHLLITLSWHVILELKSFSVSKNISFERLSWECALVFSVADTTVCMQKPKKTVECFLSICIPFRQVLSMNLELTYVIFGIFLFVCLTQKHRRPNDPADSSHPHDKHIQDHIQLVIKVLVIELRSLQLHKK